jgi:hypothetical protein
MKKLLLASIISGLAAVAAADSFQELNTNTWVIMVLTQQLM